MNEFDKFRANKQPKSMKTEQNVVGRARKVQWLDDNFKTGAGYSSFRVLQRANAYLRPYTHLSHPLEVLNHSLHTIIYL